MSVKITNTSSVQRLVRLNSGVTRRLAPGESVEVEPLEVKNRGVKRLVERRVIKVDRGGGGGGRRSKDMSAADAVEFIENADESELEGFLSPDEDRVTVLRAMEERQDG